jgi:hypothetical protein
MDDQKADWVVRGEEAAKAGLSKDMSYYIVEIANSAGNPVHRVIVFHRHVGDMHIYSSGYSDPMQLNYADLYFFKVVEELAIMNEKPSIKLPDACLTEGVFLKGVPCNEVMADKKYIHVKELFHTGTFLFEKGDKVEVIGEEPDAYLFVNHLGRQDQIAKGYLKSLSELEIVNANGEVIE